MDPNTYYRDVKINLYFKLIQPVGFFDDMPQSATLFPP